MSVIWQFHVLAVLLNAVLECTHTVTFMLFIDEAGKQKLQEIAPGSLNRSRLVQILRRDVFRPKNTGFTRRQLDSLRKAGLLKAEEGGKWQRLDIEHLLFLALIHELRQYGLESSQLLAFKDSYFGLNKYAHKSSVLVPGEVAIVLALLGQRVTACVLPNGSAGICSPKPLRTATAGQPSVLLIDLNVVLSKIAKNISKKERLSSLILEAEKRSGEFTSEGEEILEIIDNEKYDTITFHRTGRKNELVVHASWRAEGHGKNSIYVMNELGVGQYRNIEVHERNGTVATYRVEDIMKVRR